MGYRAAVLPDHHDADRHGPAVRVHHFPQVRPHLRQPVRGDADQDRGRDGGDDLQGGRVHHQAGSRRGYILHHQQRKGRDIYIVYTLRTV